MADVLWSAPSSLIPLNIYIYIYRPFALNGYIAHVHTHDLNKYFKYK